MTDRSLSAGGRHLPAKRVCDRFDISKMTLWRWLKDEKLTFPRPIVMNGRRYFNEQEIEALADGRKAAA